MTNEFVDIRESAEISQLLPRCINCYGSCRPYSVLSTVVRDIQSQDLTIQRTNNPKPKPDENGLVFGENMSDHMLLIEWTKEDGWHSPVITPYGPLPMQPAASVFHYGSEIYEGLKAYRCDDGKIRLFRPMDNMERFSKSAERMSLPTFNKEELLKCLVELVRLEQDWIPESQTCTLYVRPSLISTEPSLGVKLPTRALLFVVTCPVGPYFKSGTFNPVSLLADSQFIRAWPGGVGDVKAGGNYGATVYIQSIAEQKGCNQVLWLFEDQVTEVGTMNIFMHWINEDGVEELITPPLNGLILSGITRNSLLQLAREWDDFKVSERTFTMKQVVKAASEGRVKEMFGCGTACVVCPVGQILYEGKNIHIPTMENGPELTKRFYDELFNIQYGRRKHPWSFEV